MWDYLYMHEIVRLIIMAVLLLPMILIGALLRKKAAEKPYYNSLGLVAHFMCFAMAVAMVLGDFFIGHFEFAMLSYILGVGFALLLVLGFTIFAIILEVRYKRSTIIIE